MSTVEAPVSKQVEPVDEILPVPRLITLGLQHVLVMYAGAVAVPFIVGNALKLSPQDIAFLVSADLFACGIVTIIQSLGASQWFGIKLPVMMGVTFASVSPMPVSYTHLDVYKRQRPGPSHGRGRRRG